MSHDALERILANEHRLGRDVARRRPSRDAEPLGASSAMSARAHATHTALNA